MSLVHIRLRPIKEDTVGKLFCMAFVFFLLLFFVDTVDAQPLGPEATRLIGTIRSKNFTGAVFSDSKGEQSFYRASDKLPDGSQIVAVRADSISLKGSDGTSYDMYISHDMNVSPGKSTTAPVRHNAPAEPYAPGAIRKSDTENQKVPVRRGRHGRTPGVDK